MAAPSEQDNVLPSLFNELHRCGVDGEYDKALKVVDKILSHDAENLKALHCKVVSLIQLGSFSEALELIEGNSALGDLLRFERAYCLYRLNRLNETLDVIDSLGDEDEHRAKELKAQTLYRLEQYEDAYDVYIDLIKNSDDDYENERETNLAATVANLTLKDGAASRQVPDISENTYELMYNKACIQLAQNNLQTALSTLTATEEACKKTLEEEGSTEEEIEAELAIIRTQIAFVYQAMGKDEIATNMYNQVLKNKKPSDMSLVAIASNNIVTLNRDQNVFDSKKKMKAALAEMEGTKLSPPQKKAIALNNILLMIYSNQNDAGRKAIAEFKEKFPDDEGHDASLLEATLLFKAKKPQDAIAALEDVLKRNKGNVKFSAANTKVLLALIHFLLADNQVSRAISVLKDMIDNGKMDRLGIISALVSLYLNVEDKEAALNVLKAAVARRKEKKDIEDAGTLLLYRECAKYLLEAGRPKDAIVLLEEMRKKHPKNLRILTQLINAYSQIDPQKAKEVSKDLPSVESIVEQVDVKLLESSNWSLGARYVKKQVKGQGSPSPGTPATGATKKKKKDGKKGQQKSHKKKKRGPLPRNYNPNHLPDPERWLPKYERSSYKRRAKGKGKEVLRGTQGSASVDPDQTFSSSKAKNAAASSTSPNLPGPGPRKNKPVAAQKRRKK